MNPFKIQLVKSQPPVPTQPPQKLLPKLSLNIQSLVCLNYPIQTLTQVISSHFDEQPCSANLVTKALKIISISLKDKQLRKNIENILSQNLHKRQQIYTLILYWGTITNNLIGIFNKIQQKLMENVIGCVISYYYFSGCKQNSRINQIINNVFIELPQQSVNKICQYIKNQFMTMNYPIQFYIQSINKILSNSNSNNNNNININTNTNTNSYKNPQKYKNIQNQLSNSLIKSKQSQQNLQQTLRKYFQDIQLRQKINRFFTYFPNLIYIFISNLANILQYTEILQIWQSCQQQKYQMQSQIKAAIKQWLRTNINNNNNNNSNSNTNTSINTLANSKNNYWKVFDRSYNTSKNIDKFNKFLNLIQIGYQLQQNSILNQLIIKKQLYNYFANIELKQQQDIKLINKIIQNKQNNKRYHLTIQTISDYLKSYKNIIVTQNINIKLILINKIYAPQNWIKIDKQIIKSNKFPILQVYINKLVKIIEDLQNRNKEKGKRIQLAYHGIHIVITDQDNKNKKKTILVTYQQIINILKTGIIPNGSILQEGYKVIQQQKRIQVKKDVQSIVIQAKIVRLLKKRKQKMSFTQIYQEVVKQYGGTQESCRLSLDKVVGKGLASQAGENNYIYCA